MKDKTREYVQMWLGKANNDLKNAETIATITNIEYLEKRAQRGSREKLLAAAAMAQLPDVEPV